MLTRTELDLIDAWWRAANYLPAQIYAEPVPAILRLARHARRSGMQHRVSAAGKIARRVLLGRVHPEIGSLQELVNPPLGQGPALLQMQEAVPWPAWT